MNDIKLKKWMSFDVILSGIGDSLKTTNCNRSFRNLKNVSRHFSVFLLRDGELKLSTTYVHTIERENLGNTNFSWVIFLW